jgi:Flp pilus assembly protein TadD
MIRERGQILLIVLLVALLASVTARADPPPSSELDSLLAASDGAYSRGDLQASQLAAEAVLARDASSYEAHWRLARALLDRGNVLTDLAAARPFFTRAEAHARQAVALAPDQTRGHTCLAAALGKLSEYHGGRRKIELAAEVRREAELAVELDPDNDMAHLILGIWHREIATLGPFAKLVAKLVYGGVPTGASLAISEDHLRRAVALAPRHLNHHRELGITLMRLGRLEEAASAFASALEQPHRDPNDAAYARDAERRLRRARQSAAEREWDDY